MEKIKVDIVQIQKLIETGVYKNWGSPTEMLYSLNMIIKDLADNLEEGSSLAAASKGVLVYAVGRDGVAEISVYVDPSFDCILRSPVVEATEEFSLV